MLPGKRITTYGKRNSRIVYLSSENATNLNSSPKTRMVVDDENSIVRSPTSTRKLLRWGRKVKGHSTSPRGSPKAANIFRLASKKSPSAHKENGCTPPRQPLSLKSDSLLNSPSIVYLGTRTPATQTSHKQQPATATFAPFIDLTIDVIPEEKQINPANKRIKKSLKPKLSERQSKLTEITNVSATEDDAPPIRRPRRKAKQAIVVISDSDSESGNGTDDENEPPTDLSRPQASSPSLSGPIVISDDNDTSANYIPSIAPPNFKKASVKKLIPQSNTRAKLRSSNEILPPPRGPFKRAGSLRKQLVKDRFSNDLHLDSTLTELGETSVSSQDSGRSKRYPRATKASLPSGLQYLSALLTECSQNIPHDFKQFIQSFPISDTLHQHSIITDLTFRKIGEASYSEVFAIGDVVLKVIPLRNETATCQILNENENIDWPCESDCKDVLQEIRVTRELGDTCSGFIKLLGTFIVVGEYPPQLLTLWDEFNQTKKSENIRPGVFTKTQAYTLLVLPNGGTDLESYRFSSRFAWRQACSVFWQTVKAISIAEDSVSFEHRDLHWGQILVKQTEHTASKRRSKQYPRDLLPMDNPSYGVFATIIDLGLARMDAINCKDRIYCTPFDDVLFEGEGDYQFDVYRMIREVHSDGCWDKYRPITNVIWLHYLTLKLLRQKGLRPPSLKNHIQSTNEFHERICYECLVEMESLLEGSITYLRGKKNRNDRTARIMFSNAGDVIQFGREKEWLI